MTSAAARQAAGRTRALGYVFAVTAAAAYGAGNVLTRQNVDTAVPLVGSLIALAAGTLSFLAVSLGRLGAGGRDVRKGVGLFALAGVFSTMGVLALFLALERAPVVLVTPVSSTNPLFTLLFAALLLRDVERLTPGLFAGAALVVAGVVVLTAG